MRLLDEYVFYSAKIFLHFSIVSEVPLTGLKRYNLSMRCSRFYIRNHSCLYWVMAFSKVLFSLINYARVFSESLLVITSSNPSIKDFPNLESRNKLNFLWSILFERIMCCTMLTLSLELPIFIPLGTSKSYLRILWV